MGEFCSACRNFEVYRGVAPRLMGKCKNCGSETYTFGPLWIGSIIEREVVHEMKRGIWEGMEKGALDIVGKLDEELDLPFFYSVSKITRQLGVGSVSKARVIEKLGKNHQVSSTHFELDGIKTDSDIKAVTSAIKNVSKTYS